MNQPAPSSRELLERMLVKVEEMRRALTDAATVERAAGDGDDVDLTRAMGALDDLERRVRQMLEPEESRR